MGRHLWKTPYPYISIKILIFMVLVTNVAVNHISQTVDLPIIREVENTAITTAITKMPGSKHSVVKGFKPSMYQQTSVRKYAEAVWIRALKLQLRPICLYRYTTQKVNNISTLINLAI